MSHRFGSNFQLNLAIFKTTYFKSKTCFENLVSRSSDATLTLSKIEKINYFLMQIKTFLRSQKNLAPKSKGSFYIKWPNGLFISNGPLISLMLSGLFYFIWPILEPREENMKKIFGFFLEELKPKKIESEIFWALFISFLCFILKLFVSSRCIQSFVCLDYTVLQYNLPCIKRI